MAAPHPQRRALVVGGSLGGLFAANLLLRAGWDVHVYERAGVELAEREMAERYRTPEAVMAETAVSMAH